MVRLMRRLVADGDFFFVAIVEYIHEAQSTRSVQSRRESTFCFFLVNRC